MSMKLVKKTAEYSIFQRGDERYAVKGSTKKAINGDEKIRILLEEGLIKVAVAPAEPEPEAPAEEVAVAEEAVAEEAPAPEAVAEEAAADDADKA